MDNALEFFLLNTTIISLLVGWLLDLCFGDPAYLPHPIVGMGKWIAFGERRLNRGGWRKLKGAIFAIVSITLVYFIALLILKALSLAAAELPSPLNTITSIVKFLFLTAAVFFCLAGKTLRREVKMVFIALEQSVEKGRNQVARIVGRDTKSLSSNEVATAALETLAENLSDGVIAPLFWFCILGVPGMLAYKMINTLDSMIGYKNEHYRLFGCWAAHIDDIANYIPARITAILIICVGWCTSRVLRKRHAMQRKLRTPMECWHFTRKYALKHLSPNSGWPEAALCSILDCRFGGPHNYFGESVYKPYIGSCPRELSLLDMQQSLAICRNVEIATITLILFISLL